MKEELITELLNYFIAEKPEYSKLIIPSDIDEKRDLLRGLINLRDPEPISQDILKLEDSLLKKELWEKGIVNISDLEEVEKNIYLYFGDITTLKVDCMVNSGNSVGLGCFIPTHRCIDNAIHTYAGIRLRLECNKKLNGKSLKNGDILVCKGHNLPCNHVITVVGPQVKRDITKENEEDLKKCYENALKYAIKHHYKSIVFPCISTGLFGYPIQRSKYVAYNTVKELIQGRKIKVIFCLYSKGDYDEYLKLFKK